MLKRYYQNPDEIRFLSSIDPISCHHWGAPSIYWGLRPTLGGSDTPKEILKLRC